MSVWSVVKNVRFARNSGLLISCITTEHAVPTEFNLPGKCRSFYHTIVSCRSQIEQKGSRAWPTCLRCPTSNHSRYLRLPSCSCQYRTYYVVSNSERHERSVTNKCPTSRTGSGSLFSSAEIRCMCTHEQQRRSQCGYQDRKTSTKKTLIKAGKRMKDRYEEVEEKIRLKAEEVEDKVKELHTAGQKENIYTIPNLLTTSRIAISPLLGYLVLHEYLWFATCLFGIAGITDLLDGYIARNFANQQSVFGSILDPLADKILVGVLTVSLTAVNLIPIPLTFVIVGRDALLLSYSFYLRYTSLPPPFTLRRYFDVTHATVKLKPLLISKVNTNIQLITVAASLAAPVFGYCDHQYLHALWCLTAGTTVLSGLTYVFAKDTFKILSKRKQ
ncbi:cardiolipin synthase (CMP-forming)-like [Saccoglossus kowalevskii]|uniref:cardiolipin synthase (CMP-forming) n=1 Tax=Saccoglossus kowalevskii TaxID=10224 RepID=A0ABM0H075_SACKO|nr:PREDICTED: cardiolipin synthase-like [Saccoglossus kowalevskii]